MFRLKFVGGFVILVSLLALFVLYLVHFDLQPVTEEDTDVTLQRATTLIEKSHRLDEFALEEKARHVASRERLRDAMVAEYDDEKYDRQRKDAVIPALEAEKIRFERIAGDDRAQRTRNLDYGLLQRRPLDHDMFLAVDERGSLVATLGTGLKDRMGIDFAGPFPTILGAIENEETRIDMWNWSWSADDDRELYVVAISPIVDPESDDPLGAVVLGNRVTDRIAKRRQALVADSLEVREEDVRRDVDLTPHQQRRAPEIAFFRGDRIYSSTLSSRVHDELADELFDELAILDDDAPDRVHDLTVDGQRHRAMARFFPGQFETDNPAGFVLMTDLDAATEPFEQARSTILFATGGVIVVGVAWLLFVYMMFVAPLGRIEEGIQEVLSGDKDHKFETSGKHRIADNLAEHLNLLSAFLQGKPMPDEEQSLGGWGGFEDDDSRSSSPDKPDVKGVPLMQSDSSSDTDGDSGGEKEKEEGDPSHGDDS